MAIALPNKPRRTSNMTNIKDRLRRMELMILARQEKFPIRKCLGDYSKAWAV